MSEDLAGRALTYAPAGGTRPAEPVWQPPAGWRAHERTVAIGAGAAAWAEASAAVLVWGVKTRSGFRVEPADGAPLHVREGARYRLRAGIGPVRVAEPVEVVAAVETVDRCGFAYGTLAGHPVSGEESFVVHRTSDGAVHLTLRSLTRAGGGAWRPLFPLLLVAQRWYRRRYLRALVGPP